MLECWNVGMSATCSAQMKEKETETETERENENASTCAYSVLTGVCCYEYIYWIVIALVAHVWCFV